MTEGERFASALLFSLALHWVVLTVSKTETPEAVPISDETVVLDLTNNGTEVGLSLAAPMVLEQIAAPAPAPSANASADAIAERRREALTRYVDQLSETVHLRRRVSGVGRKLVGNAVAHIVIDAQGRFSAVVLLRSSGDAELDADALQALHASSGVIPRPRILGDAPLALMIAVKYQFGL